MPRPPALAPVTYINPPESSEAAKHLLVSTPIDTFRREARSIHVDQRFRGVHLQMTLNEFGRGLRFVRSTAFSITVRGGTRIPGGTKDRSGERLAEILVTGGAPNALRQGHWVRVITASDTLGKQFEIMLLRLPGRISRQLRQLC
jgi:hypothetical protein